MLLAPLATAAQALQRATVVAFTLSADTLRPHVDKSFHLVLTLRLRERLGEPQNLQLPVLADLEILGDERNASSGAHGTLYREVISVVAHHGGTIAIAPATFDAIDARNGRAEQYSSNALVLHVTAAPSEPVTHVAELAARIMLSAAAAILVLGILLGLYLRRPAAPAPPPIVSACAPAAKPQPRDCLREALAFLQNDPKRSGAMRARAVLHRMVGAADGETLDDVMRRARRTEPTLLAVLPAIERAAFTYDGDVERAVVGAVAALERALR